MARVCPPAARSRLGHVPDAGPGPVPRSSPWPAPHSTSPATPTADALLEQGPAGPAHRHGAGPAGDHGEGLLLPGRAGPRGSARPGRSMRRPSPPWTPTSWRQSSRSARRCTASPAPWRRGCRQVCRAVAEEYGGRADNIWKGVASGRRAAGPPAALPGFGEQKAKIFAALLGKQLGVRPEGWREATAPYGAEGSYLSVADITDAESLQKVRATKKAMKAQGARPGRDRRARDLSGRRLYLCTPDRPDLAAFLAACIARRRGRRPAARQGARRPATARPGPAWPRRCAGDTACPSSSTTGPTWPSRRVPTASTSARTTRRLRWPDGSWARGDRRAVDPRPGPSSRRRADEDVTYISAGPVEATPTKPGRPGTGHRLRQSGQRTLQCPRLRDGRSDPGDESPPWLQPESRHFVVVRYLTQAPDARQAARRLREAIDRALSSEPAAP